MDRSCGIVWIATLISVVGIAVGLAGPVSATPYQQSASGGCTDLGESYHSCRAAFDRVTGTRQFQIEFFSCELTGVDPIHPASLATSRLTLRTQRDGEAITMPLQINSAAQVLTRTHVHSIVSMPVSFAIVPNARLIVVAETRNGIPTGLACTAVGRYL